MSISPRSASKTSSTSGNKTNEDIGLKATIDKIAEINSQTDVFRSDLTKTGQDMAKIAEVMKKYVMTKQSDSKDGDENTGEAKGNKICKVYGCIYKGTYDGIIDGLKQVTEDKKAEALRQERIDATKTILKTAGKVAVQAPEKITKALINLFAFERSEILNGLRAIYHGVGYDDDGKVDYQQKAFRLMLNQEHERKKLLKDGSALSQNEQIIGELAAIRDAVGGGGDRSMFRKNSTQIDLLRKIAEGVGAQRRGFMNMKMLLRPKWMQDMSLYQISLLREISANTAASSQGMWFTGWFKSTESQVDILKDIRRYLAPREKEQSKLWQTLNTPIFSLFKKQTKRETSNIADLAGGNEDIIVQIQHSNDYLEDITGILNKNLKFNKASAEDGEKLLVKADTGLVTIPRESELTPYQLDALKYSAGIEQWNKKEFDAIKDLEGSLCDCITLGKNDDGLYESMEKTRQSTIERGMNDEEERRDNLKVTGSLQNTVEGIYSLMLEQNKISLIATGEDSLMKAAFGKVASVTDLMGNISEIKQGLRGKGGIQKVKFSNNKQIVSLSEATLNALEDIFGDDFDLPGKKRKGDGVRPHRKPKVVKTPKKKPGLLKKGAGLLKKGIPLASRAMGTGGLLTASGSTIAGLGVGAMATAAAATAAAGAVGYGIGTILNKGIDKLITKTTGGEAKSLGGWFYNLTHKKEMAAEKARRATLKAEVKKAASPNALEKAQGNLTELKRSLVSMVALNKDTNKLNKDLDSADMNLLPGYDKTIAETKLEIKKQEELIRGMLGDSKTAGIVKDTASQTMEIAKTITAGSIGLATDIVDKGLGINWQESLNKGWQGSINKIDEISDSVGVLSAIKDSQTVGAMREINNDARTFISNTLGGGGGNTTNIQVPVSPHDNDRHTNLLVHSYGS